ncbi:hypothetical protein HMPREF1551_02187 [Capnocytophaga sp. oral taxon 863 str. F0517]|nr:hypothetical protein HMPREF1551_02187 [Capnocytophaga sp. oral taxon 863 str. F0517]
MYQRAKIGFFREMSKRDFEMKFYKNRLVYSKKIVNLHFGMAIILLNL